MPAFATTALSAAAACTSISSASWTRILILIPIVLIVSTISTILFLCRTMHKDCELIPLSGLTALSITLVNVCAETCLKGSRNCERQVPEF